MEYHIGFLFIRVVVRCQSYKVVLTWQCHFSFHHFITVSIWRFAQSYQWNLKIVIFMHCSVLLLIFSINDKGVGRGGTYIWTLSHLPISPHKVWGKGQNIQLDRTSSKLVWDSYIISIGKTAYRKIGALIRSTKFHSPQLALILHTAMYGILLSCLGWCP